MISFEMARNDHLTHIFSGAARNDPQGEKMGRAEVATDFLRTVVAVAVPPPAPGKQFRSRWWDCNWMVI